jgi:aminoglycoside phosphotransferase (APT) family kinase protein
MDETYCQSPGELVERYAGKTGRSMHEFQWYQAFAAWKLGIVLEGSYAKYLSGESKNPNHEFFGFVVDQLMERAQRFAHQE